VRKKNSPASRSREKNALQTAGKDPLCLSGTHFLDIGHAGNIALANTKKLLMKMISLSPAYTQADSEQIALSLEADMHV